MLPEDAHFSTYSLKTTELGVIEIPIAFIEIILPLMLLSPDVMGGQ